MKILTIAICAYNMEEYIEKTLDSCIIDDIDKLEVLIMNDGSTDRTWSLLNKLVEHNKNVHGIKFSRNFGKEAAIFAGLQKAQGYLQSCLYALHKYAPSIYKYPTRRLKSRAFHRQKYNKSYQ